MEEKKEESLHHTTTETKDTHDAAKTKNDVIVETANLTKVYEDWMGRAKVRALDKLNLKIHRGEILGLLGPNGSGKTTTTKLLLGLLFPTAGKARIFGKSPMDVSIKNKIGFLPEESYLYRFLNAYETLDFYARLFKMPKEERNKKIPELIELVGLKHAAKRSLKEYSKGMSRRIGFAQALINDPDFIILDEPTTGLDPIGTREMKDLMVELKNRGKTILLCSHLLADVGEVCDRIAILNKGKLITVGKVKDLLSQKDIMSIQARNVSDDVLEKVKQLIEQNSGEVASVGHPSSTLENLFLRVINKE